MSSDAEHRAADAASGLRAEAAEAAAVRAWQHHPDVVALRVERVRRQIDALTWVGIALGLSFTMVNVQTFAAAGATAGSLPWLAAWLLDPMVSLVLVAVLRAEQVTARYQVDGGPWVRRTKWFTFTATYVMNTWASWSALAPAAIVLHSVPPALVFTVAETAPVLRERLTEAVNRAAHTPSTGTVTVNATGTNASAGDGEPTSAVAVHGHPVANTDGSTRANATVPVRELRTTEATANAAPSRKRFADFLAAARAAYTPDVEITPAWVREHVDCSRGSSQKVADALRHELAEDAA